MKKLMIALTLTAAGLMAAQNPAPADSTSPASKTKVKKHRKAKKTATPAGETDTAPAKK